MTAYNLLAVICLLMGFSSVQGISNSGNEFYLMFPPNLGGRSPSFPPILFVTTDDDGPVQFTVSYNKANPRASGTSTHTATKGELTRIELPEALKDSFVGFAFDGGINLKAEEGKNIIVYALNEDSASTDVYLGLPYFETKTGTYDYYGVSVPRSSLEPKATNGYMAIVTLEDSTVLSITPTVSLEGFVFGTPLRKMPGTTYRSIPQRKGVTFLLRSREDLTGTKISSNNPITFITGHECGFLPGNVTACDHLTEQLPPAETFGFRFVLVPLRLRQQDGYKIVASRDGTMVNLSCVNKDGDNVQKGSFSLNDGQFRQLFIHSDRYCTLESNLPLLVVQIALGHSFDEVTASDPFMTMVPPLGQYRNDYTLLFVESFSVDTRDDPVVFEPQLSISVPSSCFNRDQILFDGQAFPDSAEFVAVQCEDGEVCAYAAQYQVPTAQSRGAHTLKHSDPSCTVGVIVYGYERENTYGYPGGMNLDSIAVPNYCFKDDEAKGSEPSGVLKFTLQNTGVADAACITFSTTDGTATGGVDFVVNNSECCFKAGEKEAECEIKVNEDSESEGDEEFTISLVAKEGQCVCNTSIKAIISESLVAEVQFERPRYSVAENDADGCANITIVSSIAVPTEFDVEVSFSDDSATDPDDYNSESITATFEEGESRTSVCVPIVNDSCFEDDEVFRASLSVPDDTPGVSVVAGQIRETRVTIQDDEEEVFVKFSPANYTCREEDGICCLIIVASEKACKNYTVTVITSDGSASNGSDYEGGEYPALFPAGETTASVCVPLLNDDVAEPIEKFVADIMVPQEAESCGVRQGEDANATVCIEDDDFVIVEEDKIVNFNPTEYSVSEDGTYAILMLMLNAPAEENCTVQVNTSEGTARDGSDYTGGVHNVTFPEGSSKVELRIPITDDDIPELDETFTAMLMIADSAEGVEVGENSTATVTITDGDKKIVNFNPTEYSVSEDGTYVILMLMLNAPALENCTVKVMTIDGTAEDGSDYTGGVYNVTFPEGSSKVKLRIPITDDDIPELDETFTAMLMIPDPAECVEAGDNSTATVTITDDDKKIVNFNPIEYSVSEDGTYVILMLMLNAPALENCTVNVMTIDGTAEEGSDYIGGVYNVTFPEGSSKAELRIPIRDDDIQEPDETFTAMLMIPDSADGVEAGDNSTATVTITDGDKKIVNFNPTEYSVSENDTDVILMLMLNAPAGEDCTVQVQTSDGTAEDGSDYTGGVYNVTFPEGSSKVKLRIPIRDDDIPELDETFTAMLMIPDSAEGVEVGENSTATVTITDDDKKIVNFNPTEYSVSEDGTYVILMLMLNAPALENCTVKVMTMDGTAEDGSDYTGGVHNVTFTNGSSKAELRIPIIDDDIPELEETFTAMLMIPDSADGVEVGDNSTATVTITDGDKKIVNFNPIEYSVSADNTTVVLMLMLNAPAGEDCTVQVQTMDGTAEDGPDYTGGVYNVTFPEGSSKAELHIPIRDDDKPESDETFTATLMIPDSAEGILAGDNNTATVTIIDDDKKLVNFNPTEYSVSENDTYVILMLMLNAPAEENCTVKVMTIDGTAINGSDYTGGVYNVTFFPGASKANLFIPIIDDDIEEPDETFMAMLMIPEPAECVEAGEDSKATVTIRNDDEEIVVSLDPEDYTVNETDGFAVITVKASRPSSKKYTVMINTQDGTATETGDYAAGPYPVMFAPGETEVQVMIPLMDDDVKECDEEFFGQLSIPEEAADMGVKLGDAATATVTIDDNDTFEVNFVSTKMEVFESESKIVICLEHDGNCTEEFTVQIGNQPHSNMSASSPDDYQNGPYDVLFEKGKNRSCVEIPVIDDGVEEGPENFQLEIIPAGDGGPPFQPGLKSMAQVTLKDGNIDGDPMFTVPLNIDRKMLSKFSQKDKQWDLCYEVHGREEKIYNLVSDQCVFVNTHLKIASNPKVGNIMARIGIMAMDRDGKCHRILADLDGKKLTVNGVDVVRRWMRGGIIVRKFGDKVDVAVPNCKGRRMVFSIIFHYMNGADMIKFIIADGRGLSPSSHGLIGQFWNTPVEIQEVSGKHIKTGRQYKVVIYSPFTGPREFIGDYYPMTWDYQKTPCLYAGTRNGVPVIEGKFTKYEVKNLFDPKFDYSQFSQDHCSK